MEQEKKEMNVYVYVAILTSVTALILSLLYTSLNPLFVANKATAKRKAILQCIPEKLDLSSDEKVNTAYEKITMLAVSNSGKIYEKNEESKTAINAMADGGAKSYSNLEQLDLANEEKKSVKNRVYPVYTYDGKDGKYYIVAVRGNGLWDKIWAYIALKEDLNTIAGIYFDHKNETPGLGAEIKDSEDFKKDFIGKKVFDNTAAVAVAVVKREPPADNQYHVKGISGATITCDGVTDMFVKGMKYYEKYFDKVKNS